MQAIKGSGSARFALFDTDTLVNEWYPFGNMTALNIAPSATTVEVTSTDDTDYGSITDSEVEPGSIKITASINRFSPENMALIYAANANVDATVGGTVVTPEAITAKMNVAARLGGDVQRSGVTAVVVKDHTDVTTYVKDTDYTLDSEFGFITPIGSTIKDGDILHVTYTYAARTGIKLDVNTATSRHISLLWKGINRFDGKRYIVEIPKCTIQATKGIDLMGKSEAAADFDITPVLIPGMASAVTVRMAE